MDATCSLTFPKCSRFGNILGTFFFDYSLNHSSGDGAKIMFIELRNLGEVGGGDQEAHFQ